MVGQVTHLPGPGGSAKKPAADPKAQEEDAQKHLALDVSQPTTNVQVGLKRIHCIYGTRKILAFKKYRALDEVHDAGLMDFCTSSCRVVKNQCLFKYQKQMFFN